MATETRPSQVIQKSSPTHAMTPFEEMDRLFDSFLRGGWIRPFSASWPTLPEAALPFDRIPRVDVIDRDSEILVRAELPGAEKKDIDISVSDDSVTIKGSINREEKEEKSDYYRHELISGSFSRTVGLPATVDGARSKANFKDGVLELTLPKLEKTKRHNVKVE